MSRELQPYEPPAIYPAAPAPQVQTVDLRRLMRAIRRQRSTIVLPALLMMALGVVYAKSAPDIYSGYASLMLDSNMNGVVRQAGGIDGSGLPEDTIENARVVLSSDKLAFDVLDRTGLQDNPAFMDPPVSGFSRAVGTVAAKVLSPVFWLRRQVEGLVTTPSSPDTGPAAAPIATLAPGNGAVFPNAAPPVPRERRIAANVLQSNIDIYRQGRSTAVAVRFDAYDPAIAAAVANAYVDAYVADTLTANASAVGQTTAWMRGRVEELRAQAQAAADAAEKFSIENNLAGTTGGGELLSGRAVNELNSDLTTAIGERARAQAVLDTYDAAVANGVEGLTSGNALSIGGTVSDELSARLGNFNDVRARLQRMTAAAGPNAPQVAGLRQTLASAAQRLFVELQVQQQQARSALEVAEARVKTLQQSLDEATRRNAAQSANLVRLNALQREAETLSTLYQTTLSKAQEIEQQQSFPVSNVRILSYAQPPVRPSGPSTTRAAAAMGLLGLFFGILAAAIREGRERFMRAATDVTETSPLRFLGYLPALPRLRYRPAPPTPPAPEPPPPNPAGGDPTLPVIARRRHPTIRLPIPALTHPRSVYAETLRHIHLAAGIRPTSAPVLGITSFHPYPGRAMVSLNVAAEYGKGRSAVLLIDADHRGRTLSRMAGLEGQPGLADAAVPGRDWRDMLIDVAGTNITLLACGTNAGGVADELTVARLLARLVDEATGMFDGIVVDVPPLYPVAQGRAVLEGLPQFAVVAEWGRTPRALADTALADRPDLEARCLGVVFDRVNLRALRRYLPRDAAETFLGTRALLKDR